MAVVPSEILSKFRSHFETQVTPEIYRAPGRVNLIGEHTDYNLGFVFPIALEMACFVALAPAAHGELRIYSSDLNNQFAIPVDSIASAKPSHGWSDYVVGVARELARAGIELNAADLWIGSNVPAGSGLSSSAALEVASALALLGLQRFERLEIARLAQRAETQFVGMPCGIMDQYASVFGQEHSAIQIDCRSLTHEYTQLPGDVLVIAVNSLVKHELGASAYRDRVAECQQAVAAIQKFDSSVESLRDVSIGSLEQFESSVPAVPRRRARHIVTETQRVLDFAAASRSRDLREMGRLFVASHRSMQYDYEITCAEIDFLVDTALELPGVYGSRMTGGGFGGCTVNLVAPEAAEAFRHALAAAYRTRYSISPEFYACFPSAGASRISG